MKRINRVISVGLGGVVLLVLVLSRLAAAQEGLVGYWPFDGSGADLSEGGRDLDLFGGVGFAPGLFGQALDLHGNPSHYAARPGDHQIFDFGAADFTLQLWLRINQASGGRRSWKSFRSRQVPDGQ
jgi:hypothetical protein